MKEHKILDVTCGDRTIWFQKNEPHTIYCDKRREELFRQGGGSDMIAFPSNRGCPRCKGEMQYICLNSIPPQYKVRCLYCGYEEGDNVKQTQTNGDKIRAMSDGEIEEWYWWMHKEMMHYTDSRVFVHEWLKQEVDE